MVSHHPYPSQSLTSQGPGGRGQSTKENQEEEQDAFQGEGGNRSEISIEKGWEVEVTGGGDFKCS